MSNETDQRPLLLLSATIRVPEQMIFAHLRDQNAREKQYRISLDFWQKYSEEFRIVVVENSNTRLDHGAIESGRLEYYTYEGNTFDCQLGKGKGEMEIMRYLFSQVKLPADQIVIKMTGRQYVKNIGQIVELYRRSNPYIMCNLVKSLSRAEPKLIISARAFLTDYLLGFDGVLDDSTGVCFEDVLQRAVIKAIGEGKTHEFFPVFPQIRSAKVKGDTVRESVLSETKKRIKARVRHRLLMGGN